VPEKGKMILDIYDIIKHEPAKVYKAVYNSPKSELGQ